jgi:hypothetical protein
MQEKLATNIAQSRIASCLQSISVDIHKEEKCREYELIHLDLTWE